MRIIRSFLIALSMYSKIPVPRCEWKEEDMKYVFIFFPLIGIVIGGLIYGWNYLCRYFELPDILRVCITAAIPIIITGGIHADGFMDTMDALHSYRDKEKKLEILKDPHIGAFSVIM
ncbi:MAG: adenosylcobinamide-GDP ribazoletransferase, partial [Lachnospiraceae bacterium]|nr:adenosylcobinamide-GDP ribazoletransferase [Lachnospiraceae bacterium]